MSPIPWDATLETGDAVVDHQHRAIHNLFNRLESADDNEIEVMRALDFLTEHVLVHFATEEDLMAREEFPQALAEVHVAEHRRLSEGVRDYVIAFRTGELSGVSPIVEYLRGWLVSHVHACDRKLVNHIHARGSVAKLTDEWTAAEGRASV
jgi:hemerythrin